MNMSKAKKVHSYSALNQIQTSVKKNDETEADNLPSFFRY